LVPSIAPRTHSAQAVTVGIALLTSLACGILVAAVTLLAYQAAAQIIMAQGG
jgi:hypothetical protein